MIHASALMGKDQTLNVTSRAVEVNIPLSPDDGALFF
jgi:hypothetical protein